MHSILAPILLLGLSLGFAQNPPARPEPFLIRVVDDATGRGVPLVELRTVNEILHVTDSNGLVAFNEPGLMEQDVFFNVRSHGYEFPKDGFGIAGKTLKTTPGAEAELRVTRRNIAERLYRVTGQGVYRDTVLAGRKPPTANPVLNGLVLGQDSVQSVPFNGKIHWFWGDTNRPSYPLGNFHTPGATSLLPAHGGLDPEVGIDLAYIVDQNGFAKQTCNMPGDGPTWIGGLIAFKDPTGRERLFTAYAKIKPPLDTYERGLAEWDDQQNAFKKVATFPLTKAARPDGHPFRYIDNDVAYIAFPTAYPLVRVRDTIEDYLDIDRYEAFTCLEPGSTLDSLQVERDGEGKPVYAWKHQTPPVGPPEQDKLLKAGKLKPEETLLNLRDIETGRPVTAHGGSVNWNPYRSRWILIAVEIGGEHSLLGDVRYAEADTPLGPWVYARRILSHDKYSFYNPKHHPFLDKDGGRTIFFEGTYTHTFSGNPIPTPRYDYNQVMYKLDLSDPRLNLPVPVRRTAKGAFTARPAGGTPAFFALDRERPGSVPVYARADEAQGLTVDPALGKRPDSTRALTALFHAAPESGDELPPGMAQLVERISDDGRRSYEVVAQIDTKTTSLCRIWINPLQVRLPTSAPTPR
jgi:hypothetical protein